MIELACTPIVFYRGLPFCYYSITKRQIKRGGPTEAEHRGRVVRVSGAQRQDTAAVLVEETQTQSNWTSAYNREEALLLLLHSKSKIITMYQPQRE